jgi:transcription elongation factor Elf1
MPCKRRKKYLSKRHWCPKCDKHEVRFVRKGDRHGFFECLCCKKMVTREELKKVN